MHLRSIMKTDVVTTHGEETAEGALELMQMKGCHHLVVIGPNGIEGIISERDLGGPKGERVRAGRKVRDLMSSGCVTAAPETTLREAAEIMRGRTIGCLPVLDDGKLCGIVTVSDLLAILAGGSE